MVSLSKLKEKMRALDIEVNRFENELLKKEEENYVREGHELYEKKQFTDAIASYKKALDMNKRNVEAYTYTGACLSELEYYGNSLKIFDTALRYDSSYKRTWYHKGLTFKKMKKYKNAIGCFDGALVLDPDDENTKAGKISCLVSIKRKELEEEEKNARKYFRARSVELTRRKKAYFLEKADLKNEATTIKKLDEKRIGFEADFEIYGETKRRLLEDYENVMRCPAEKRHLIQTAAGEASLSKNEILEDLERFNEAYTFNLEALPKVRVRERRKERIIREQADELRAQKEKNIEIARLLDEMSRKNEELVKNLHFNKTSYDKEREELQKKYNESEREKETLEQASLEQIRRAKEIFDKETERSKKYHESEITNLKRQNMKFERREKFFEENLKKASNDREKLQKEFKTALKKENQDHNDILKNLRRRYEEKYKLFDKGYEEKYALFEQSCKENYELFEKRQDIEKKQLQEELSILKREKEKNYNYINGKNLKQYAIDLRKYSIALEKKEKEIFEIEEELKQKMEDVKKKDVKKMEKFKNVATNTFIKYEKFYIRSLEYYGLSKIVESYGGSLDWISFGTVDEDTNKNNLEVGLRKNSIVYLRMTGRNIKNIPFEIKYLENLEEFNFSKNDIKVIENIGTLKKLKNVYLNKNRIELIEDTKNMDSLKKLNLFENPLIKNNWNISEIKKLEERNVKVGYDKEFLYYEKEEKEDDFDALLEGLEDEL